MPKQYRTIAGEPVLVHTLRAMAAVARVDRLVVVLSPADDDFERAVSAGLQVRCTAVRTGGVSRSDSVQAGLQALADLGVSPDDWVLVHDAARCLVEPAWVDRLIDACQDDPVGGLLALPLADTMKASEVDAQGQARSMGTLARDHRWLAQTPQMFRAALLRRALAAAGAAVTDEAGAIEALGLAPRLVTGSAANLKVTWPEDFALAERLMHGRSR